tara:strand:+ start:821 stop:1024 length:204 start_codon:yes stop_codon:yes gene_type:complete
MAAAVAKSVGEAAILHNDRYGHSLGFSVADVGCCHNYALCNLAWGVFWRERWQQLFTFLRFQLSLNN